MGLNMQQISLLHRNALQSGSALIYYQIQQSWVPHSLGHKGVLITAILKKIAQVTFAKFIEAFVTKGLS